MEPSANERAEAVNLVTRLLRVELDEEGQERAVVRLREIFGHDKFMDDMYYSNDEFTPEQIVARACDSQGIDEPGPVSDTPVTIAVREALRALQMNDLVRARSAAQRALDHQPDHPVALQILRAAAKHGPTLGEQGGASGL